MVKTSLIILYLLLRLLLAIKNYNKNYETIANCCSMHYNK